MTVLLEGRNFSVQPLNSYFTDKETEAWRSDSTPQSYQVRLGWQLERRLNQGYDWKYEGDDRMEILSPLKLHQLAVFPAA